MMLMRRNYFYTLFALTLATGNMGMANAVTSADNAVVSPKQLGAMLSQQTAGTKPLPDAVKAFLATPMGKHFTAEQVMAVYGKNNVAKAADSNIKFESVIEEDFSKMTAGTEDAPDATDIADAIDSYTATPGWSSFLTYQAGGKAYLGYDEVGSDGPGYLMTPAIDLSEGDGVFKLTFRVKNVNPNSQDQGLQYFVMNNPPEGEGKKSMLLASTLPMTTEWQNLELLCNGGVKYTSVMFLGWQGKVLVDNVKVEKVTYPLRTPQNVTGTVTGGGEITATWDAVEGATKYKVGLQDTEDDYKVLAEMEVTEPKAVFETAFDPSHKLAVTVEAMDGEKMSYPGHGYPELTVEKVDAPVALAATNVSTSGFTANWEKSQYAANYNVSFMRTHTATADGETLTYFDDDFSQIPYSVDDVESTYMSKDMTTPVSLDDVFKYPGWSTLIGMCITGGFGITNTAESYGLPGAVFGPVGDYSIGEGKAHITGTALTMVDDAQVKVGFGKLGLLNTVTFNDGAQVFDVSTKGGDFDVEVSGGTKGSRLIFQIIDTAEGGDVVLFNKINATASLVKGDTYTSVYTTATVPYDATSYTLEVPFTGNDRFDYTVTGTFGDVKSDASNTITVYSPEADGISGVKETANAEAVYTTLDGVRVANTAKSGVYVVKQGGKTFKVLK